MENENMNFLELIQKKTQRYFTKQDYRVFLTAFVLTLLVHFYIFTHKFINHDDVGGLFSSCEFGLSSGRWLLHKFSLHLGGFSGSWWCGTIGALFLSLGAVITIRILRIRRYIPALLVTLCLVSFPTVASTYTYMFCAPHYFFSLAFAALGAWLIHREKLFSMVLGSVVIALSMGCYQSYLGYAAALLVFALILDVCENRWDGDWKKCFLSCLKCIGFLILGLVLYVIILKICLKTTGTMLTDYQGISSMGELSVAMMFERVIQSYGLFFGFYCDTFFQIFGPAFPYFAFACLFSGVIGLVVCVIYRRLYKKVGMMILLALMIIVFPIACSFVLLMAGRDAVHLVMVYPLVLGLLFPAIILDRLTIQQKGATVRRFGALLVSILLVLQITCCYDCAQITNRAYFYMDQTYENTYAYFTKLCAKIELTPGYTLYTPVALIGTAHNASTVPDPNITGVITGGNALNIYTRNSFLLYFLGTYYRPVSDDQVEKIKETAEFAQMPIYPDVGSIRIIDGIAVVKLTQ